MKSSQTMHPELPLFADTTTAVVRKKENRPNYRAKDSEGRFVCEVKIPTREVFVETQSRREDSVSKLLRIRDEEIRLLKAEIKKYKHD